MIKLSDDVRGPIYRIGAHAAWWGSLALLCVHIMLGGAKPMGHSPNWLGLVILTAIGVAIALGNALSRMRLAGTIEKVLMTGMRAATALQVNVNNSATVLEINQNGRIDQVEHAEVIGWQRSDLLGQDIDALIPERLRFNHGGHSFRRFYRADDPRIAGQIISIPVLRQDGTEKHCRLTVARVGDVYMATLAPTIEKGDEAWYD